MAQAGAHALFQGGLSAAQGGDFWQGAAVGGITSYIGSYTGGGSVVAQSAMGGFMGGTTSLLTGGDFTQGFATGLTVSALNHALHKAIFNLKFNVELKKAYGDKVDSSAPKTNETICEMIDKVPTLEDQYYSFEKEVTIKIKDQGFANDGSDAKTYALNGTKGALAQDWHNPNSYSTVHIDIYGNSFSSYKTLARIVYHEFIHVADLSGGLYYRDYTKYRKKYSHQSAGSIMYALGEIRAYNAGLKVTGQPYTTGFQQAKNILNGFNIKH